MWPTGFSTRPTSGKHQALLPSNETHDTELWAFVLSRTLLAIVNGSNFSFQVTTNSQVSHIFSRQALGTFSPVVQASVLVGSGDHMSCPRFQVTHIRANAAHAKQPKR